MERRRDAQGLKRLCDGGILEKYSTRKRFDELGSPVRKVRVVHRVNRCTPEVYALMELYPQARAYRPGIEYLPYPAVPSSTQGEKEKK